MTGHDWIGLTSVLAVFVAFVLLAGRLVNYFICCGAICVTATAGCVVLGDAPDWGQCIVLFTGLFLLSFGLSSVRVMVERSVSLNILANLDSRDKLKEHFRDNLYLRTHDITKYGLGIRHNDKIELTSFGLFIAFLTGCCHAALRMQHPIPKIQQPK